MLDAWQCALRFSLANAMVFLILSLMIFFAEPDSLSILLFAPTLFFLGAVLSFVLLIRSGGAFAAVAWFILGAGMYFGLGVVVGGLDPHPGSIHAISSLALHTDLIRINLLNSSSVMLVLVTAIPFSYAPTLLNRGLTTGFQEMNELLLKVFPLMTIVALVALMLQFLAFPDAGDLLVRIFLSYFSVVIPFSILAMGMLWTRLKATWAALGIIIFMLAFGLGLLTMSKYATMSVLLPLVAGIWVHRRSAFSVILGLLILGSSYAYLGGIMDGGRMHPEYDSEQNSPLTRFEILSDTIFLAAQGYQAEAAVPGGGDFDVPVGFSRLSITAVQGYLVDQYERNSPGTSLDDFWVAAIPRVLWPDKPIITRFGTQLHEEFWNTSEATSALAPTYSGEAYWNNGPAGLVLVSILLGLEMGWLTRRWQIAASGDDPAFFLIAFPVSLWAVYVESWIAASYIGGFITIVVLWLSTRFVLRNFIDVAQPRSPLE